MRWLRKVRERFTGLTDAIARFPLTSLFLLAAAVINAYSISTEKDHSKFLLTFILGAFLSAVAQVGYERFYTNSSARLILMAVVILLTAGYYIIIRPAPGLSTETEIRTAVALFGLLWAFIWVPVIKSTASFNQSFMIAFKALFNSAFFSAIIFAGISIILAAFNELILTIDYTFYPHIANLVFVLFAPMYFLSLIPSYPNANEGSIKKAAHIPKFLEILLSYILIPLLAVFTLIIVLYIVKNLNGQFWTDNLLEPMLVSYAITVILLYILVSDIDNKFTITFRKIFPKILIPIVLFQIASSVISLTDTGVTHTRYYVILFGIFAAIAGLLFSLLPVRKNGLIAALLILFAAISIVPPVDAFTISRNSQISTLKNVLLRNDMLDHNEIKRNGAISQKDQQIITDTVFYLTRMEYIKEINWLPKGFDAYKDFYETFGFKEYQQSGDMNQSIYLNVEPSTPMNISGFDRFIQIDLYKAGQDGEEEISEFNKAGKTYTLLKETNGNQVTLKLMAENNKELIRFNTQEIFDKYDNYHATKETIPADEATFTKENDRAKITIVVQNVSIEKQYNQNNASIYLFVQIK
ncbi:DUF4153 domain-containing protein [Neobacillus cucumis]|uniref:DUF4153 domain-containing protein n=1 Tax=Neobacillus cucumis TaxID=1740721 RepID=UPI001964C2DF|nr:DUF4153 domain-containing protein [Neobacillus cucumis]MBM7654432.1 hypothetical protein [Neobacillus cucumis]